MGKFETETTQERNEEKASSEEERGYRADVAFYGISRTRETQEENEEAFEIVGEEATTREAEDDQADDQEDDDQADEQEDEDQADEQEDDDQVNEQEDDAEVDQEVEADSDSQDDSEEDLEEDEITSEDCLFGICVHVLTSARYSFDLFVKDVQGFGFEEVLDTEDISELETEDPFYYALTALALCAKSNQLITRARLKATLEDIGLGSTYDECREVAKALSKNNV